MEYLRSKTIFHYVKFSNLLSRGTHLYLKSDGRSRGPEMKLEKHSSARRIGDNFFNRAIKEWNTFPEHVVNSKELEKFKKGFS